MTRKLAEAGIIAALYVALCFLVFGFASGAIQCRVGEALCVLPVFTAAGIPGVTIGCFLFNLLSGAALPDIIFGTLATFIGAVGTRLLRKAKPKFLALLPPVLSNALIIPFVLKYAYELSEPIWFLMLTVCAGEIIAIGILGSVLRYALEQEKRIFPPETYGK